MDKKYSCLMDHVRYEKIHLCPKTSRAENLWHNLLANFHEKVKDKALVDEKEEVSYYHLHKFDKQYDQIIKISYKGSLIFEPDTKKRGR